MRTKLALLWVLLSGCASASRGAPAVEPSSDHPALSGAGAAAVATTGLSAPSAASQSPGSAPRRSTSTIAGEKVAHVAGVTFRVPASWTLDSDGQIAVAKNHEGDVRLVFWGGDTSDAPNALHRADAEFGVPFDVKVGSLTKQLAVGRLPYGFVLSQGALERDSRLIRLAMLSSKGVKSEALALLTYANTPKSDGAAASKRVADALDEILNTFEPEP